MCVVLSFPLMFIGIILYFSSIESLIACSALAVLGGVVYYLLEYAKTNKWCDFHDKYETADLKAEERAELVNFQAVSAVERMMDNSL